MEIVNGGTPAVPAKQTEFAGGSGTPAVPAKASTITMTTSLNTSVNIELAYELFSVLYPRNPDGTRFVHPKNIRNKIPYFGIPNSIICVKYKGKIRGIRQNEGQMNNVVSIDLQACDKNINLKLAKTKIQLTGATSHEMGKYAFEMLCAHVNMIQANLCYIRNLSEDVCNDTITWVMDYVYDYFTQNGTLPYLDVSALPKEIDAKLAGFVWQYMEDFDDFEPFQNKIQKVVDILNDHDLNVLESEAPLEPVDINISNSVYNFNLGKEVSLIQLSSHLMKKGFRCEFHNWNANLKVSIPIEEEMDDSSVNETLQTTSTGGSNGTSGSNGSKVKAHRFSIHKNFSIKQTSPSCYEQAMEARDLFLYGIADYVPEY
jgi:hypothetical protein